MSVDASTRTASAPGWNDVTTKSNFRPITLTLITSPRVIARPWRTWAMYCSPPLIRVGRRERDLLRGAGQRLAEAHLVVDPDARVPALYPVHPDHAAVRVFRITAADPGRGRLRPFNEDDVPFLQFEDLHDLGVEPHD